MKGVTAMQEVERLIRRLEQIRVSERQMREDLEVMEAKAEGVSSFRYDKVTTKTQPQNDKLARAEAELLEEEQKQAPIKREFYKEKLEAAKLFWTIDDKAAAYILEQRFVQGISARQYAADIGMSVSFVKQKIRSGLSDLERRLK